MGSEEPITSSSHGVSSLAKNFHLTVSSPFSHGAQKLEDQMTPRSSQPSLQLARSPEASAPSQNHIRPSQAESSDSRDTLIEQLGNCLEKFIPFYTPRSPQTLPDFACPNPTHNPRKSDLHSAPFCSSIRVRGQPILPPVLTASKRNEMQQWRQAAKEVEMLLLHRRKEQLVAKVQSVIDKCQTSKTVHSPGALCEPVQPESSDIHLLKITSPSPHTMERVDPDGDIERTTPEAKDEVRRALLDRVCLSAGSDQSEVQNLFPKRPGVPQGPVFSPKLFSPHVNELSSTVAEQPENSTRAYTSSSCYTVEGDTVSTDLHQFMIGSQDTDATESTLASDVTPTPTVRERVETNPANHQGNISGTSPRKEAVVEAAASPFKRRSQSEVNLSAIAPERVRRLLSERQPKAGAVPALVELVDGSPPWKLVRRRGSYTLEQPSPQLLSAHTRVLQETGSSTLNLARSKDTKPIVADASPSDVPPVQRVDAGESCTGSDSTLSDAGQDAVIALGDSSTANLRDQLIGCHGDGIQRKENSPLPAPVASVWSSDRLNEELTKKQLLERYLDQVLEARDASSQLDEHLPLTTLKHAFIDRNLGYQSVSPRTTPQGGGHHLQENCATEHDMAKAMSQEFDEKFGSLQSALAKQQEGQLAALLRRQELDRRLLQKKLDTLSQGLLSHGDNKFLKNAREPALDSLGSPPVIISTKTYPVAMRKSPQTNHALAGVPSTIVGAEVHPRRSQKELELAQNLEKPLPPTPAKESVYDTPPVENVYDTPPIESLQGGNHIVNKSALDTFSAVAKGYLCRRLMDTQRVRSLAKTIQDSKVVLRRLQSETPMKGGAATLSDLQLREKLYNQLEMSRQDFFEIHFVMSAGEKMSIILEERFRKELQQLQRPNSKVKSDSATSGGRQLSSATLKSLARRAQRSNSAVDPLITCQPARENATTRASTRANWRTTSVHKANVPLTQNTTATNAKVPSNAAASSQQQQLVFNDVNLQRNKKQQVADTRRDVVGERQAIEATGSSMSTTKRILSQAPTQAAPTVFTPQLAHLQPSDFGKTYSKSIPHDKTAVTVASANDKRARITRSRGQVEAESILAHRAAPQPVNKHSRPQQAAAGVSQASQRNSVHAVNGHLVGNYPHRVATPAGTLSRKTAPAKTKRKR